MCEVIGLGLAYVASGSSVSDIPPNPTSESSHFLCPISYAGNQLRVNICHHACRKTWQDWSECLAQRAHSVRTSESRPFFAFFASTLEFNLSFRVVAYIGFFLPGELLSQLVGLLEVVTGICDFAGRKAFGPVLTRDFDNDWGNEPSHLIIFKIHSKQIPSSSSGFVPSYLGLH